MDERTITEALRSRRKQDKAKSGKDEGASSIQGAVNEIDWAGFKIRSSVIGLVILFMSLLYFYLYLVFVYPIT